MKSAVWIVAVMDVSIIVLIGLPIALTGMYLTLCKHREKPFMQKRKIPMVAFSYLFIGTYLFVWMPFDIAAKYIFEFSFVEGSPLDDLRFTFLIHTVLGFGYLCLAIVRFWHLYYLLRRAEASQKWHKQLNPFQKSWFLDPINKRRYGSTKPLLGIGFLLWLIFVAAEAASFFAAKGNDGIRSGMIACGAICLILCTLIGILLKKIWRFIDWWKIRNELILVVMITAFIVIPLMTATALVSEIDLLYLFWSLGGISWCIMLFFATGIVIVRWNVKSANNVERANVEAMEMDPQQLVSQIYSSQKAPSPIFRAYLEQKNGKLPTRLISHYHKKMKEKATKKLRKAAKHTSKGGSNLSLPKGSDGESNDRKNVLQKLKDKVVKSQTNLTEEAALATKNNSKDDSKENSSQNASPTSEKEKDSSAQKTPQPISIGTNKVKSGNNSTDGDDGAISDVPDSPQSIGKLSPLAKPVGMSLSKDASFGTQLTTALTGAPTRESNTNIQAKRQQSLGDDLFHTPNNSFASKHLSNSGGTLTKVASLSITNVSVYSSFDLAGSGGDVDGYRGSDADSPMGNKIAPKVGLVNGSPARPPAIGVNDTQESNVGSDIDNNNTGLIGVGISHEHNHTGTTPLASSPHEVNNNEDLSIQESKSQQDKYVSNTRLSSHFQPSEADIMETSMENGDREHDQTTTRAETRDYGNETTRTRTNFSADLSTDTDSSESSTTTTGTRTSTKSGHGSRPHSPQNGGASPSGNDADMGNSSDPGMTTPSTGNGANSPNSIDLGLGTPEARLQAGASGARSQTTPRSKVRRAGRSQRRIKNAEKSHTLGAASAGSKSVPMPMGSNTASPHGSDEDRIAGEEDVRARVITQRSRTRSAFGGKHKHYKNRFKKHKNEKSDVLCAIYLNLFDKYMRRMSAPLEINISSQTSQRLNNWYYRIKLTQSDIDDIEDWWLSMMEAGKEVISLIRDSYARFRYAEMAKEVNEKKLTMRSGDGTSNSVQTGTANAIAMSEKSRRKKKSSTKNVGDNNNDLKIEMNNMKKSKSASSSRKKGKVPENQLEVGTTSS